MAQVTITQVYSAEFDFTDRHERFFENVEDIIGGASGTVLEYTVTRGTAHGYTDRVTHSATLEVSDRT